MSEGENVIRLRKCAGAENVGHVRELAFILTVKSFHLKP